MDCGAAISTEYNGISACLYQADENQCSLKCSGIKGYNCTLGNPNVTAINVNEQSTVDNHYSSGNATHYCASDGKLARYTLCGESNCGAANCYTSASGGNVCPVYVSLDECKSEQQAFAAARETCYCVQGNPGGMFIGTEY